MKLLIFFLILVYLRYVNVALAASRYSWSRKGRWQLLLNNTGVVPMHMALTHLNTVVMFDQTGAGPSRYRLRRRFHGRHCSSAREDLLDSWCYAHSVEYDVLGNKIRALRLDTDPWCSSASFLSNGTLLQTGGYESGSRRIRYFRPCRNKDCDWRQSKILLSNRRWYASSQLLPENDQTIVVGGRSVFSYEFVPKLSPEEKSHDLPFLHRTHDENEENNLYPFLHLSSDGNLFIFANRDSILFNYKRNKVVKTFPRIPGKGSRNYPSSGSSVILPLDHADKFQKVEVLICGGSASGAYTAARRSGSFLKGLRTCGRMVITGNRHKWSMENMPAPRLLHDMLILPTGHILIINGAQRGSAGWNNAAAPSFQPYVYKPKETLGTRFSKLQSTRIARLYHSSAILLPDGRILVGGGNPNRSYNFSSGVAYPTELRLQAFVPHYMDRHYHLYRPQNVSVQYQHQQGGGEIGVKYGEEFTVHFWLGRRPSSVVDFSVYAPPFTTHSISMNQRMLKLRCKNMERQNGDWIRAVLEAPPSPKVAPSGYYMLAVVNGGIPSFSQWIRFIHT